MNPIKNNIIPEFCPIFSCNHFFSKDGMNEDEDDSFIVILALFILPTRLAPRSGLSKVNNSQRSHVPDSRRMFR